jgi:hypothetical protein
MLNNSWHFIHAEVKMIKLLVSLAIPLLVLGCADTARINPDSQYSNSFISMENTAYVALSENGSYGDNVYAGSGASVSSIIRSALLRHLNQVYSASSYESFNDAILSAQKKKADYLFFPSILHWEDRATEWSAIPDKVEIKITVISTKSEQIVSSVTIDGKSGLATLGGDHPQDLLPQPITDYVNSLIK